MKELGMLQSRWAVICSAKHDLGSQFIEKQWEALFVFLVCTSLLPDEEKAVLHTEAKVKVLEPKSDHTFTCSDPTNGFPSRVSRKPK